MTFERRDRIEPCQIDCLIRYSVNAAFVARDDHAKPAEKGCCEWFRQIFSMLPSRLALVAE